MTIASTRTIRFYGYAAERDNEVVRRVRIYSDVERPKVGADTWHQVRVGVSRSETETDWLGGWSQRERPLPAREPIDLTGPQDLNFPLTPGNVCVVEVARSGWPEDIEGTTVEWKFARVGGVRRVPDRRLIDDASYPRPRRVSKPLFSLGRFVREPNVRQAAEALEAGLNTSGISEWVVPVPLFEMIGARRILYPLTETVNPLTAPAGAGWTSVDTVAVPATSVTTPTTELGTTYVMRATFTGWIESVGGATDWGARIVVGSTTGFALNFTADADVYRPFHVPVIHEFEGGSAVTLDFQMNRLAGVAAAAGQGHWSIMVHPKSVLWAE